MLLDFGLSLMQEKHLSANVTGTGSYDAGWSRIMSEIDL